MSPAGTQTITVHFPAPVDTVFDYLADPRRRPEWQSSLKSVRMIDDGEVREGMRWVDVTAVPGVSPAMAITQCIPHRVWAERGSWRGVSAELVLRFTGAGAGTGTIVVAEVAIETAGPWRVVGAVVRRLAPTALGADLRKAAGRVADLP